jgi:hypothetical protein
MQKRLLQPRVTTMALHIHKATSVHKGQGISCGKGKPDELAELDLIAFLQATERSAKAIYDALSITR